MALAFTHILLHYSTPTQEAGKNPNPLLLPSFYCMAHTLCVGAVWHIEKIKLHLKAGAILEHESSADDVSTDVNNLDDQRKPAVLTHDDDVHAVLANERDLVHGMRLLVAVLAFHVDEWRQPFTVIDDFRHLCPCRDRRPRSTPPPQRTESRPA